jgi:hypothetical protein
MSSQQVTAGLSSFALKVVTPGAVLVSCLQVTCCIALNPSAVLVIWLRLLLCCRDSPSTRHVSALSSCINQSINYTFS